ncbi:hypothetical protein [Mycobacterium sp. 1164985.4]|uniref:hypothetical protein n=1 Tax=Mycobacterium sp. 1164985.4 TaxID=1834069 RepID=UPI0007FB9D04|nr:hypothetical protein [Mycobacterium sp. 1164985.4]OBK78332.1 hypothetical protein A5650_10795 [Mycobacterium sp. 1164985.4]
MPDNVLSYERIARALGRAKAYIDTDEQRSGFAIALDHLVGEIGSDDGLRFDKQAFHARVEESYQSWSDYRDKLATGSAKIQAELDRVKDEKEYIRGAAREEADATTYYSDGYEIVAFEHGLPEGSGDAMIWTPRDTAWVHCPASTGIAEKVRWEDWGKEYRGVPDLAAKQREISERLADRRDYSAAALEKQCVSCAAPVGEPCNPECPATAYSRAEEIKFGEPPQFSPTG